MIGRQQRAAALASLVGAHGRYGTRAFRVDRRGPHWSALHDAAELGWCWWPGDERCALTDAGLREIEPYRREQPAACVSYVCPVCQHVVGQPAGETGLPVAVTCPNCAKTSAEAAERMRQAQDAERGEDAA